MTAKQKIKIDIVVFALVALLMVFLGLMPLLSSLAKTSRELSVQKAILLTLENQIAVLKDFQDSEPLYQANVEKIDASFIAQEAPIAFIEFLEQEAQAQGLDILISSVKEASEKKAMRLTTAFQAAVAGSFSDCFTFLKRLEKSPWLVKIDQINMDRVGEKEKPLSFKNLSEGEVVLNLAFKTFSSYLTSFANK